MKSLNNKNDDIFKNVILTLMDSLLSIMIRHL